jgi:hypothetical protein
MTTWMPYPYAGDHAFTVGNLEKSWGKLHAGDAEPLPLHSDVRAVWCHFHNGEFARANDEGLRLGESGLTAANKACCVYANYLEPSEQSRLRLFLDVAERAQEQARQHPENANAWYWQAYALGRYSQGVSVAKALAQGLGRRIREALERTIALQPQHADAHIALGTFHAEVIDKVGSLIGAMTYGAKKNVGLKCFRQGLALNTAAPIAMVEFANGLVMLEGDSASDEATRLYEQAARSQPLDAMERLDVELAKAHLKIG